MSALPANSTPAVRSRISAWAGQQRVLIALFLLILFGALRYDHFLGAFNVLSVLRYNSMFALTGLGMCFVIMTAGIDLSVGTTAALASVVSAMLSPLGVLPGLLGGLAAGVAVGMINGFMVTRMRILPFIATLSGELAASGTALLLAHNQSVSVSYDTDFTWLGQGDFLGFPVPAWIALARLCLWLDRPQLHQLRPQHPGDRRQRRSGAPDGPAGRSGRFSSPTCSRASSPVSPASSSPPSSAPASRPRASAGNCSRSPPSSSAEPC